MLTSEENGKNLFNLVKDEQHQRQLVRNEVFFQEVLKQLSNQNLSSIKIPI